jgi:ABC-type sugar transport system ATPase subunit
VESLDIRYVLDRSVRNLSGGERQRTALARAVASGCKNLVLDEPLSALHQSLKKELWYVLKDIQKRYDLAVLMVTHDLNEAFFLGDVVSIIIDGNLHQQGNKGDVYRNPGSEAVARFLGVTNLFRVKAEDISEGSQSVDCEELGARLRLSVSVGQSAGELASSLAVGIRPEDVEILMPGDPLPSTTNTIAGTIRDVYEHEHSLTVIALCGSSLTTLEAAVPRSMSRKLAFSRGQSVQLRLPEEDLFLIQDAPRKNP